MVILVTFELKGFEMANIVTFYLEGLRMANLDMI